MHEFFREGGTGFEDMPHKGFRQVFRKDVTVDVFFQHAAVYRFPFLAVGRDGSAVLQAVFEVCHFMNEYNEHDVGRQVVVQRYEVFAVRRSAVCAELSAARRYQSYFRIGICGELFRHFFKRLCGKMCGREFHASRVSDDKKRKSGSCICVWSDGVCRISRCLHMLREAMRIKTL